MARGLIHPDLLEFISNQQIFGSCILAPSMYIKQIWDSDKDYKVYKDQIFTNLHETHSNSRENKEISKFYAKHSITEPTTKTPVESHFHLLNWGIDETQIQDEMERQEMANQEVSLLFAMKWFSSELTNKGEKSPLVSGLLSGDTQRQVPPVRSVNELLTLVYMSYLESNNYLKSREKYLFGELVKSTNNETFQEQVFLFFEMLKVFFPGGDPLIAPDQFADIEASQMIGKGDPNEVSIKLLSRVFSLVSLSQCGISLKNKKLQALQNLTKVDFDVAQFCSLVERFKFTYRTAFQVILFRAFMTHRASIEHCSQVAAKLGFRKEDSGGLVGLLLKSILARESLKATSQSASLFEEFRFLSQPELVKVLECGAELWMILKKIHQTGCNRSGDQGNIEYLRSQFDRAHTFFVDRMKHHNSENKNLFEGVVAILEARGGRKPRNINLKKTDNSDGLSSQ